MRRLLNAVLGGLVGTTVLSTLLLLLEVETRSRIGVFAAVARFVGMPGNTALGFVVFAVAGTVAWPVLFVALGDRLPGGDDPAVRGLVFGTVLWVAFLLLGRGDLSGVLLVVYAAFTLVAHLAYGYTLGAVYHRLSEGPRDPFPVPEGE